MNLCSAVKNYDHDGAGIQVFMTETIQNLNLFFQCHGLGSRNQLPYDKISFHIPLHRMLSAFLYLGSVGNRHLRLRFEQLDKNFFRQLLIHPLHIMVILNESTTSMWIRNGRPFQAAISFYRHYLFGMSFIDLDLFLIKYAAGVAGPSVTLDSIFAAYHVNELWRQATSFDHSEQYYLDKAWISVMAEAVTTDVLACLFLGKNAHSAIVEALCDRGQGWLKLISDHLEDVLKEVAEFKTPDSGGEIMSEGSYTLKEECWFEDFDPVYCRIRTFKSAEFGELCLKVEEIDRKRLDSKKKQAAGALWIPFRICSFEFNDEQNVHAVLGAMILCDVKLFDYVGHILHFSGVPSEAEHDQSKMSSLAVQQAIYLLTLSIAFYKSALMAKADLITDDLREQYSRKNLLFELFSHQVRNVTVLDHVLRLYRQQMKDRSKSTRIRSVFWRICGNGIHYIGRLFCLAYRSGDLKLKKAIDKVLECGAASREESPDSETDRTARRLVMKRKQQEIMANLSKKNARLLKQMERQEDANTSGTGMEVDSPESEETEQFCSLCKAAGNYTQGSTNLLGSFAYVAGSPAYMLAMGCEDEELLDEECTGKTRVMYAKQKANMCSEKRILNVLSLHSVIGFPSAEIRSCGHLVHLRCYETYMRDTVEPARQRNSNRFRAGRYQVTLRDNPTAREPCPICRQQYNSFLPIVEPIHGVGLSESHGEERTSGELMASLMRSVKYFEPIRYSSAEKNYFRSLIRLCKEVVITFKLMGSVEASLLAVIENGITLRRFGYKDLNRRALVCGALAPLMATNLKNVDITNTRRFLSTLFYPMFGPRGKNRLRVPTLFFHMKTMFLRGLCFIGTDKSCSRNESVAKVMLLFKHVLYATLTKTIVLYIRGEKVTNVEKLLEEVNLLLGTLKGVPVEVYGNVVAAVLDYERLRSRELPLSVVTEERSHKLYNADELFKILESTTQDLVHFTLSFLHFSNLKHFEHMPSYSLSNDELFELLNGLYLQDFSFEKKFVSDWIGHYLEVPEVGEIDLDVQEPLVWKNRTLIDLDNNFDDIFKYNYNRECLNCDRVSKNPMVCLVCGTLVCIEYVERSRETSELISHVKSCTSGNCCFLSILTSLIVIVQNYEYSIWGSVYLDNHGEEDRQLKRGRPLFLNKNRYRLG
ncbi:hypothetical protein L596_002749 [Steinernema carpocapsae]|uniref:E3 ubiquitin-protein ligase n=1 Tax=Steinernema carpocapsae TaxID=34508 RepID=A0A4U8US01_STECR|nr:hypothetical protein L596_002749 [Steinernema carpocapsae]